MRILRVITRLNIGGPSIQAIELTTRLAARGYDTLLAHGTLGDGEGDMRYLLESHSAGRFQVTQVPHLRRPIAPMADVRAAAELFAIMRHFRPAIVHTHMAKAGSVGRLAALAYNRTVPAARRTRLVHTYHGHVLEGYFSGATTRVFIGIERALARATDRIVAISPRIRDELVREHRIGRSEQYRVIPLGFDLQPFLAVGSTFRSAARERLNVPASARVVSTVGRLTAIKQHRLFLEVARLVADRRPDTLFLIAGDGELRAELEAIARVLRLEQSIRFLGWRRDLDAIYAATDVFLLTSRNEGTPVAIIESLAAGTPAVATDVGGVADVISTPSIGGVAPFDDASALARLVIDLLADDDRRIRAGDAGRAAMRARFDIERLLDDVDAMYREVTHGTISAHA